MEKELNQILLELMSKKYTKQDFLDMISSKEEKEAKRFINALFASLDELAERATTDLFDKIDNATFNFISLNRETIYNMSRNGEFFPEPVEEKEKDTVKQVVSGLFLAMGILQ